MSEKFQYLPSIPIDHLQAFLRKFEEMPQPPKDQAVPSRTKAQVINEVAVIVQSGNHAQSMKILADNGMRALTYQEAFVHIMQNPGLKDQLKGKLFYLADVGTDKSDLYTIDAKGELKEGRGNLEETVCAFSGKNPLSLGVDSNGDARDFGRRFGLYSGSPDFVAPVVVGVKQSQSVSQA